MSAPKKKKDSLASFLFYNKFVKLVLILNQVFLIFLQLHSFIPTRYKVHWLKANTSEIVFIVL